MGKRHSDYEGQSLSVVRTKTGGSRVAFLSNLIGARQKSFSEHKYYLIVMQKSLPLLSHKGL